MQRSRPRLPSRSKAIAITILGMWAGFGSRSAVAQPANDSCFNCSPIGVNQEQLVSPAGGTIDGSTSCDGTGDFCCFIGGGDVWYCVTPCCPGPITVSTCNTSGINLSVHTDCPGTAANEIACNLDGPNTQCPPGSQVTFTPTPGQAYYIRVAYCGGTCTPNPFFVFVSQPTVVPPNNACASATTIAGPVTDMPYSTCGATTDGPSDCPGFNDIWYNYTPPACGGNVTVSAHGVCNFDPSIGIYCPTCPAFGLIACSRDTVYNGPVAPNFASVRFYAVGGRTYRIRLGGAANTTGSGTLSLSFTTSAPANDLCSAAIPIAPGVDVFGTTMCATATDLGICFVGSADVWYVFSPACPGTYTVNLCEPGLCVPSYDTVLAVYSGCPANGGTEIICNDNACGLQSLVTFTAVACQTYYIRVAGAGTSRGDFRLILSGGTPAPPPSNNPCSSPIVVSAGTIPFNTCGATTDGPSVHPVFNDIWYRYRPACSGTVTVSTCGSPIAANTSLAVYTGVCGSLTFVSFNDNPEPPLFPGQLVPPCLGTVQSFLQFTATANTDYLIRVGSPIVGNYVCGRLNIIGPNPSAGTCPPGGGAWMARVFQVLGPSNNAPWAWCLSKACCMSVRNLNVPGEPITSPVVNSRNALAARFAASIAASCPPGTNVRAYALSSLLRPGRFVVLVRCPTTPSPAQFVLSVGPANTPCDSQCVVASVTSGPNPLPTSGPCSFNPPIEEIPLSGVDCNGNGQDDLIDILSGASADANDDDIPDECQPHCPGDFNRDGSLNSQDFFDFISCFFTLGCQAADFNHNGSVNSQDFFDFVAAFFAGC